DPNNYYHRRNEMTTTDNLDFKHHNYKEMRQVGKESRLQPCRWRHRVYLPQTNFWHVILPLVSLGLVEHISTPFPKCCTDRSDRQCYQCYPGNEINTYLLQLFYFLLDKCGVGIGRLRSCHALNGHSFHFLSPKGSELGGWSLGRWTQDGIDINNNFPDLNSLLWESEDQKKSKRKVPNHHIPIPDW
ncbi:CPXM2 protein, partial [Nothocercus julius]|nr:CPXM2 protein [Nothocercus julius]